MNTPVAIATTETQLHDCGTEHMELTEETYDLQQNCKLKLTVLAREDRWREGYLFFPLQIKPIEPQKNCKSVHHHNNEKNTVIEQNQLKNWNSYSTVEIFHSMSMVLN